MSYRVAPIFLIRLAGVPFDRLEGLATPETTNTARGLIVGQNKCQRDNKKRPAASLERELEITRKALLDFARTILPRYLIFAAEGMRDRISSLLGANANAALPPRNARARERERHLLLYLQRIAAKNDTFSEFGPSAWGRVDPAIAGVQFDPAPGIANRNAFLERWTAHAVAATINADPEVFPELRPRRNPAGLLLGDKFV